MSGRRTLTLLALLCAVALGACDGFGVAVVGPLPEPDAGLGPNVCEAPEPCEAYRPEEPELWTPPVDVTAGSTCTEFTRYALSGDAAMRPNDLIRSLLVAPQGGEGPDELRCVEIDIEVPSTAPSFELDLRSMSLHGVRLQITSDIPGRLLLGTVGAISDSEFTMRGPIDIIANRVLMWSAQISLQRSPEQAQAGALFALESQFTQLSIVGEGTVSLRRSSLREAQVRASRLTSELSPWSTLFVRADTVEVFEANLFEAHIEAGHFIAAAGTIGYSEFVDCVEIILASVTLSNAWIGPTEGPVRMSGAIALNSYIEADLVGSCRVRQSALLGHSIDLEQGSILTSALCGVDFLGIEVGDVACIRCDGGAPPDTCVSVHPEPACPGFDTAPCSRGERHGSIPEDVMGL